MGIDNINTSSMQVSSLFRPGNSIAYEYLSELEFPWEALPQIASYVKVIGAGLDVSEYEVRPNNVWIHKSATIAPTAHIGVNVIIGAEAEVRHCAFIRNDVIVGCNAVIGNSTELKNVILFDSVQVPHYNYVGDSILGYKSHLGAGAITSNVKSDGSQVFVCCADERVATYLKKFGAILGDNVEVGCNAVLNPGTIIGSGTTVYPLSSVRGFISANSIYKSVDEVITKR